MQVSTQRYDRRPYGVGLLVAGYDESGPHIYQTCPSANYFDCKAMAIGSRSQSARTYLEKHLTEFPDTDVQELVKHGLRALRDTLPNEDELNSKVMKLAYSLDFINVSLQNVSIAIVGKNSPLKVYDEDGTTEFLRLIEGEERRAPRVVEEEPRGGDDDAPAPPPDPVVAVAMDTE